MKSTSISRIFQALLTLTVLCAFVRADNRGPAPQFTAKTLDGETFTNKLSDRVEPAFRLASKIVPYYKA